jgi:hypothetical protein
MSGWRDKVCGEQGRGMGLPATQEKRFVSYEMRYFTQSCGFSHDDRHVCSSTPRLSSANKDVQRRFLIYNCQIRSKGSA